MLTTLAALMMAAMLGRPSSASVDAVHSPSMVIVLDVTNEAHILARDLELARRWITKAYRTAGVRIEWNDGFTCSAQPDNALHVDVRLISRDPRKESTKSAGVEKLGKALRPIRRTYVFYEPLQEYSMRTGVNTAQLLGAVITHEVGHLLFPASTHLRSGIMSSPWYGGLMPPPTFTSDEGRMLRAALECATAPQRVSVLCQY